jgi:uncharacterized membrane protein YgcG
LPGAGEWEQFVPYAAAFGLLPSLARRGRIPAPPWLQSLDRGGEPGYDTFMVFIDTASTSATAGDGGGSAGSSAGASGGGASGAG